MTTRVYLPVLLTELVALRDTGVAAAPHLVHAVTEELRSAWPEGGDDQWEYAALLAAAESCRALWTPPSPRCRIAIAADVDAVSLAPGEPGANEADPTLARIDTELRLAQVAAIHVDLTEGADEDEAMAWFATQELDEVIAALSGDSVV